MPLSRPRKRGPIDDTRKHTKPGAIPNRHDTRGRGRASTGYPQRRRYMHKGLRP